ncbi:MAG: branched-chain amino acid ABC transporter permease/ATP-binding protein [Actinomycetota bacterium]|nr:branched-chain amino acid ABC transporter permease/ATP-binding protein [Actinomycetota bacterium]
MTEALNIIIGGIITGCIYALLAAGFSLVFSVTRVLNLTQGAFVTAGALIMFSLTQHAHFSLGVAFVVALIMLVGLMSLLAWVLVRPAMERVTHSSLLMMMGGLLTAFQGIAYLIWGSNPYTLHSFSGAKPVTVFGADIVSQDFWIVGTAAMAVLLLYWLLFKTRFGQSLRASAENPTATKLMGISVDRVVILAFALATALGVIAGAVMAPTTSLDFASMSSFTNDGLIAVTIGGLGSVFGAIAGGLVLGVLTALITGYVSSVYGPAISLGILILLLIVRPEGLLSRRKGRRADTAEKRIGRPELKLQVPPNWTKIGWAVLALVLFFGLPKFFTASGTLHTIDLVGIFALAIVGLELLTGVSGQVSLGQAGFMAVGGYVSALMTVNHHVAPIWGLLGGIALSLICALILGLAGSRVRGMYLAVVTLAFGIFVPSVATGMGSTGGPSGISGIPSFSIFGYAFNTDVKFFYLIFVLVAIALYFSSRLIKSHRGRLLKAMNEDDVGISAIGLDIRRAKIMVFLVSAAMASIAGSLYAGFFHFLSPDMVGSGVSLQLITMLVIGGTVSRLGPLIGVTIITFLPNLSQQMANVGPVVDGLLLVIFLRYLPDGIIGVPMKGINWISTRIGISAKLPSVAAVEAEAATAAEPELATLAPTSEAIAVSEGPRPDATDRETAKRIALSISGLSKSFGGVMAVRDVSFDLEENSIGALIGPNGAGKSTLFNLITNLYIPDSGSVTLWGNVLPVARPHRAAELGLFRTFQTSRVFEQLSVVDNVLLGGSRLSRSGLVSCGVGTIRARKEEHVLRERAMNILVAIGLGNKAYEPAGNLPLAAQKHLDLARALMSGSKVLLLDEPGAGMNDAETEELGSMLLAIRDAGRTILVVDHNMALVMGIAEKVTVMDAGHVIASGLPEDIQKDPTVISAYFGSTEVRLTDA